MLEPEPVVDLTETPEQIQAREQELALFAAQKLLRDTMIEMHLYKACRPQLDDESKKTLDSLDLTMSIFQYFDEILKYPIET